ncbi:peptidoglycan editing factor PgeF [Legionella tucsonensis]|uniref:Purine nucleoside phosphorylase n=1 Tax=Legionella tucsonensis TaxID=40335 RepID=A0A0W0ZY16_9GAMM|nr:peptidoglycan editing factor PgeF [Legionella tucsonensis]KTD73849.1 Laccase domain protein YfiH [Legionella tucsonensis]
MNVRLEFLTDCLLESISSIEHGFFTRTGGISEGAYSSLNCSYYRDNKDHVRENRHRVMSHLGKAPSSLRMFTDMYSDKTIIVDRSWDENTLVHADAMVTNHKNIVLGALSADCPVLLFADTEQQVIGIAHAGWRSARAGIIESCISKMLDLGAKTENIVSSIGPCIAQESYEVDSEFYKMFINDDETNLELFIPSVRNNFFMFDLRMYVLKKLKNLSVSYISYVDIDTYKDEKRFFSCRRSYHKNEKGYGCNLSFINLKE